jgi:hypothetical protein
VTGGGDVILVGDGEADIVDCGADADRVHADRPRPDVASRCESVQRTGTNSLRAVRPRTAAQRQLVARGETRGAAGALRGVG